MVGNSSADNSGNILVDFDYNNIIVVDPNKTIDNFGKISERLIDHENLVMFANLEAEVVPRTKLSIGGSPQDKIKVLSIAKMNFLKPTKDGYLNTGYYDEFTGKDTTNFRGANQPKEVWVPNISGGKAYAINTVVDEQNVIDNGLLGITSIKVTTSTSFIPSVTMELEDVQGKALFQLGNESPYAAFFNLPYCPFYLTIKGYYGQAVRYQLNLEKFNARYNSFSGNYQITLVFRGYKFNILNEISVGNLIAAPHMYSQRFDVSKPTTTVEQANPNAQKQLNQNGSNSTQPSNSKTNIVEQIIAERGYEKIVEVYSEYKSKGLIPPNFPELTLAQLMNKLKMFIQNIQNQYSKEEFEPLTNIRTYKQNLKTYYNVVRGLQTSWFNTFLNQNPIILNDRNTLVYTFKENLDVAAREAAKSKLDSYISQYNILLAENPTLGKGQKNEIKNPITYQMMTKTVTIDDVNWIETTTQQTNIISPTSEDVNKIIKKFNEKVFNVKIESTTITNNTTTTSKKIVPPDFFVFEGDNRFDKTISQIDAEANKKLGDYETKITASLAKKIEDFDGGIGFRPSVRNIIAVIMASAEGFIRLLDDVHTNAWEVKYDPVRKSAILDNPSSAQSTDTVDHVVTNPQTASSNFEYSQIPVYPWPQFFIETPEDKKGRFQLKYIGDPSVVNLTKGYNYSKWPEVEFVEEFMKGLAQKFNPPVTQPPTAADETTFLININAIEYPQTGIAYSNKEEIKYFYELWERQFVTSHYSNFVRGDVSQQNELINLNIETETNNILNSIGTSSPFLAFKLKNFNYNSNDYQTFLRDISNQGTGRAYQDFLRDFFVTPYIKSFVDNSFSILSIKSLGKKQLTTPKSQALIELVSSSSTNAPLIIDTYPFTYPDWVEKNMAYSTISRGNQVYNTNQSLTVFPWGNVISNFEDINNYTTNRPVTNFSYLKVADPTSEITSTDLNTFYSSRVPENFIPSEGYCENLAPNKNFTDLVSTSILNTPYFINAIQNGVDLFRSNKDYPFVQAAYLFLNSLPLASLKERYQSIDVANLDYIASCFKKFGAVHKMPYAWVLKMGSIWYRYKTFVETGEDILESAWKGIDYVDNYSPIQKSKTQEYTFKESSKSLEATTIILEENINNSTTIQVGFYPKVINDFNVFYNGYELYDNYNNQELQKSINNGMKVFNFGDSNINTVQNSSSLNVKTWSVVLPNHIIEPAEDTNDCIPVDNTKSTEYFIIPSFGTSFNQTRDECISNGVATVNLTDNQSMFNGSVRLLWASPNYGYFDSAIIKKPEPNSYLNYIIPESEVQSPMFLSSSEKYSKIEEIFSVFEKSILDKFETEFLNFCRASINNSVGIELTTPIGISPIDLDVSQKNFQLLFRNLMKILPKTTSETNQTFFQNAISNQLTTFVNGVAKFLEGDVILRYGNPSNYKRRVFDSFLTTQNQTFVLDPIVFKPYVTNSLPSKNGITTLSQSKSKYPSQWKTLETEVGFSTITGLTYSNNGSYITDFFIDNNIEFSIENITLCAPLIKMYATQKLANNSITPIEFKNSLQTYLGQLNSEQNNFFNTVMVRVRAELPEYQQLPERTIQSVIDGQQSKLENYEIFKALNDKWVAGSDFKSKTLFEDTLFLDRASRNIGDTILIDIFDLQNMINESSLNMKMSVYTLISGILIKNNFVVMPLPAYVNFYNVQDVDNVTQPNAQGSLQFANSLWGTFLEVDYRNSGPKMVCFYASKPSSLLDLPKQNSRFRDDSFEMRRASDNPLLENMKDKKDWALSNKCVGFNVDIGTRNQNIFYSFSVSQENGKATSESIQTQLNIVNQANGTNSATQNVSLYNLYKSRSYQCNVVSLGNAMLQPMMYFNLRHVPMFNGPYLITDVSHTITSGQFQTSFNGTRQGIYDLPALDNYLQSININLLTKLEAIVKSKKDDSSVNGTTESDKSANLPQTAENSKGTTNQCTNGLNPVYSQYVVEPATSTNFNQKQLADAVIGKTNNEDLQTIIYSICYVKTFAPQKDSGLFLGYNYNLAMIDLTRDLGSVSTYFSPSYSCINVGGAQSSEEMSKPIVAFANIDFFLSFMVSKLTNRIGQIKQIGLAKYTACYWSASGVTETYYDNNKSEFTTLELSFENAAISAKSVGLKKFELARSVSTSSGNSTNGSPSSSTQICIVPKINSISPLTGKTGTEVSINGSGLDTYTAVTINGLVVTEGITFINSTKLKVVVPKPIDDPQTIKQSNVFVRGVHGNSNPAPIPFTYNPTQ